MNLRQAKKMLRQSDDVYTPQEVVAKFFDLCTEGGWPANSLAEILVGFDADEQYKIRSIARWVLDNMQPEHEGFQQGYVTTDEGDGERMLASPVITREFIEALSVEQ
ncbi:MAG: hypothetical protein KDA37_05355 [Planctomycetales bacterium]|nr:hypothetical protein [Planctomycetales bacterium]